MTSTDELLRFVELGGLLTHEQQLTLAAEVRGQADALQAATDERDRLQGQSTDRAYQVIELEAALQQVREWADEWFGRQNGMNDDRAATGVDAALGVGVPTSPVSDVHAARLCKHGHDGSHAFYTHHAMDEAHWCDGPPLAGCDQHDVIDCEICDATGIQRLVDAGDPGSLLPVPENPTTDEDECDEPCPPVIQWNSAPSIYCTRKYGHRGPHRNGSTEWRPAVGPVTSEDPPKETQQ